MAPSLADVEEGEEVGADVVVVEGEPVEERDLVLEEVQSRVVLALEAVKR
jgi:hypothetical protein